MALDGWTKLQNNFLYDKEYHKIVWEKKTITEKPWQNMLQDKIISSLQNLGY